MAERKRKTLNNRLARNFHRTFIPEKQYLGALLKYAANNGLYDLQSIADATGIPTGISSGKAIPTADYCVAMHLVVPIKSSDGIHLSLTPFGRTVMLEDKFFREDLTQWIAHFYLCNKEDGAETWFQLFWSSTSILGEEFERDALDKWICSILNITETKSLGPTIRMYSDEISFLRCGAIAEDGTYLKRRRAPLAMNFATGYAAWITDAIERNKRGGEQVTVDELESYCGFRSITGWTLAESQQVLAMMEQKGAVSVDRHMRPWIVCNKTSAETLWKRLYEDFI